MLQSIGGFVYLFIQFKKPLIKKKKDNKIFLV